MITIRMNMTLEQRTLVSDFLFESNMFGNVNVGVLYALRPSMLG